MGTVQIDYNGKQSSQVYKEYYDPDGKLVYVEDYGYNSNSGLSYNKDHWLGASPTRNEQLRGNSLEKEVGIFLASKIGAELVEKYGIPMVKKFAREAIKRLRGR